MSNERIVHSVALLLALALTSLNLRPALTSVAPLMERIVVDLHLSRAIAGLVTTIPVLLMGLLAPFAPILAARWTQERVLSAVLVLLAVALAARSFSGQSVVWLLLSAFGAGVAIALAGPLLSGFIKQHFANRIGTAIAVYSVSLTAGASLAVVMTLPLSRALYGHWGMALGSWSVLAIVALLVWLYVVPMPIRHANQAVHSEPMPLRSFRAWLLTAFFAAQSGIFYALATWLVAHYEQQGLSSVQASGYTSLFMSFGIVGAFLLPLLASRVRNRQWLIAAVTGGSTILILSIAWWPGELPWLVSSMLGVTTAGTFALALALPVLETNTPAQASSLTSMMCFAGYLLGGGLPSIVGIIRDLTGHFTFAFALLAGLSTMMVAIAFFLPAVPSHKVTQD